MARRIDITGRTFGQWRAVDYAGKSRWNCVCICGAKRQVSGKELRKGHFRWCDVCGIRHQTKLIDLTNMRFGRLVVSGRADRGGGTYWNCLCDCGKTKVVLGKHLRRGATGSCRCHTGEITARRNMSRGGLMMLNRTEYATWAAMLARCTRDGSYVDRGITVCARWRESFAAFLADMGPRPPKHSIDRINNDGNYEPSNCRWATRTQQMRNTRANRYIEKDGERRTAAEWGDLTGIHPSIIRSRVLSGWTAERALTEPVKKAGRPAPPASTG